MTNLNLIRNINYKARVYLQSLKQNIPGTAQKVTLLTNISFNPQAQVCIAAEMRATNTSALYDSRDETEASG